MRRSLLGLSIAALLTIPVLGCAIEKSTNDGMLIVCPPAGACRFFDAKNVQYDAYRGMLIYDLEKRKNVQTTFRFYFVPDWSVAQELGGKSQTG